MDWGMWEIGDISYYFRWYIAMPYVLGQIVLPCITYLFFCRYCRAAFSWYASVFYTGMWVCLCELESKFQISGGIGLVMEILLLIFCGHIWLRKNWMEALTMAVLIISILSVTNSMIRWLDYRIIAPFVIAHENFIVPSDAFRELLKVLLLISFFVLILQLFREGIVAERPLTLLQLTIPGFFIASIERVIQDSIYGKGLAVDYYTREIQPNININYGEILFLQILAGVCLFAALLVHQKIVNILYSQQRLCLLEQQTEEQEKYMEEAKVRYQKTSSFRHDIKNHLTVLAELLKMGEAEKAYGYLVNLEEIAKSLSYPVSTGNTAVDALLGSKCFIAKQKGIQVQCEIKLPGDAMVKDIDWCIILANGIDNAIEACESVDKEERYIHISNKRKGNFYVLSIENSCNKTIWKLPEEGTGIYNIRAAAESYQGRVETSVSQGVYKLNVLFIIPAFNAL